MIDPISTFSPLRQSTLAAIYNNSIAMADPPTGEGNAPTLAPDGTSGLSTTFNVSSTSYVIVSTGVLSITFTHDASRSVLVYMPLQAVMVSASTVAEMGVTVDGILDAGSVIRVSGSGQYGGAQLFITAPVPAGTSVIRLVARIVSGASPDFRLRWNQWQHSFARDI